MQQTILLGGGCFWCIEAGYLNLPGIKRVKSGYAGGHQPSPTYQQVCSGETGHAEVVLLEWDDRQTSLEMILEVFFILHDPTSLNQQGNDIGTQYRSFIGYQHVQQLEIINKFIAEQQQNYSQPIVTELVATPEFYPAGTEHHDYYRQNTSQPYCQLIIKPKLDKLNDLYAKKNNSA